MKLDTIFLRLGFGRNAAHIYNAVLKSKTPVLVTHISKSANVDRPEVYRNLSPLLKQGFISKVNMGKRFGYIVEDPKLILKAFSEINNKVEDLTRTLARKEERNLPKNIVHLTGPSGIRAVFDDVINRMPKHGTFYRFTSERNLESVNKYLSTDYRKNRDKKKLERLVISNPLSGKAKRPRLERFIKFIPQEHDLFDQNIIQLVYEDSVAFINLSNEKAYIIRDKDLAKFQAVIFGQLYKKLL